jgi:hypothetical protein
MAKRGKFIPQQDTGWGLIFRLNDLWRDVERHAPRGEYSDWNFKLDRIWCNLLYREKISIKEKDGKVVQIKFLKKDVAVKDFLDEKIREAKLGMKEVRDEEGKIIKEKYIKAKKKYYDILMLKDIWLRKFMHELGLYLKEIEYDPSKAIYGG